MTTLSQEEQDRILKEYNSQHLVSSTPESETLRILNESGHASPEQQKQYQEQQLQQHPIDPNVMINAQYSPSSPIMQGHELKRLAGHALYGAMSIVPGIVEGIPEFIGGAVDEVLSHTGAYSKEGSQYPIRDWIDAHVTLDDMYKKAYQPVGGAVNPTEAGVQATVRGAAAAFNPRSIATEGMGLLKSAEESAKLGSMLPTVASDVATANKTAKVAGLVAAGGGVGASAGFALTPGSLEQKQQASAVGEAVASTYPLVSSQVYGRAAKAAVNLVEKTPIVGPALLRAREGVAIAGDAVKGVFGREDFWKLSVRDKYTVLKNWKDYADLQNVAPQMRNEVTTLLDKMVNSIDPETLKGRLRTLETLQKIDPNFQPGMGAVFGTTEAKAFQQAFEIRSPDFAQEKHTNTLKAIENIRKQTAKNPEYTHGRNLGVLLDAAQTEAETSLASMQANMDTSTTELLKSHFDPSYIPADDAAKLRANLEQIKSVYEETKKTLYEIAKPPNPEEFKVNADSLIQSIRGLRGAGNIHTISEAADPYLGGTLQNLADSWMKRAKKPTVIGKAGLQTGGQESVVLNYDELRGLEERLGNEWASLKNADPTSKRLSIYVNLRRQVGDLIKQGYEDFFPEGIKLRDDANVFFQDSYLPRIRTGTSGEALAQQDGQYSLVDDSLMSRYWYPGEKVQGARDFKQSFMNATDPETTHFNPSELRLMDQQAKEAETSLRNYATNSLYNYFQGKNPLELNVKDILTQWKHDYRGVLKEYPDIARKFETTDDAIGAIADMRSQIAEQRDAVNRSLIKKMTGMDPDKAVEMLLKDEHSTDKIINEIDNLYSHTPAKAFELKRSLSDVILNNVLDRSLNKKTGIPEYGRVADLIADRRHVLSKLMGQEELKNLNDYVRGLEILRDRPALNVTANLNEFEAMIKKLGMSPASMLSRWYTLSIDKTSPMWVTADAATRFFLKRADAQYTKIFKELLYSPESLKLVNDMVDKKFVAPLLNGEKGALVMPTKASPYPFDLVLANLGIKMNKNMFDTTYERANSQTQQPAGPQPVTPQTQPASTAAPSVTQPQGQNQQTDQQNQKEVLTPVMDNGKQRMTHEGRPVYQNQWGDQVTERTITVALDQKGGLVEPGQNDSLPDGAHWYNIPTVYDGQFLSQEEAAARLKQQGNTLFDPITNRPLKAFSDLNQAVKSAEARSPNLFTPASDQGNQPQTFNEKITPPPEVFVSDNKRNAIQDVYNSLIRNEGASGDTTGAAVTGALGVTAGAKAAVPGSEGMTDQQVAREYLGILDRHIPKEAPYAVRYALLDTAYNLGAGMFDYKGLSKSIDSNDWMGVARNLLDTASIGGQASRGIAARRARAYNMIAKSQGGPIISNVMQAEDGTLSYLDSKDKTIFSYRPHGGRHETSSVGMLNVQPTTTVALNTQP